MTASGASGALSGLADPADVELLRIGDRLAGFAVLLPAEVEGTVLLAVPPGMATALRARFPRASVVETGRGLPAAVLPEAGSVSLAVVDTRCGDPAALCALLAPDGVLATIGSRGRHLLYPDAERPELVWRPGWPLTDEPRVLARLRRDVGLWTAGLRRVPRLHVAGPAADSLAERIRRDLSTEVGEDLRLVGVVTAGHTILRLRGRTDFAVRVSWVDPHGDSAIVAAVRADVPAAADLLPDVVATGEVAGHPWTATRWVPRRRPSAATVRWAERRRWAVCADLADRLGGSPLARTGPGWARRWVEGAHLLTPDDRDVFARVLARLEDVPTGWCHGDPWPANVLVERGRSVVIDWDNATPEAPLGLDHVLRAVLRLVLRERIDVADACARLVEAPDQVSGVVVGRTWPGLDRDDRVALVLAAFVLHLRNRALHDLGAAALDDEVTAMRRLVTAADPEPVPVHPGRPWRRLGVARGALWLGAGAALVKGAQTVVLLLLAAILEPSALGVLAIGSLVLTVTSAVTDMGSSTALVYWRGDAERAARTALTIALGFAGLLTAAGWAVAPAIAALTNAGPDGAGVIRGLLLALPLTAIAGVSGELLRRELSFARRILPDVVGAVVGAVVSVVLALQGSGVFALVVGQVVQAVLRTVLCWVVRAPVRPGWRSADARRLLAYGQHLAGANLLQLLTLNVDYLLVGHVLGAQALGEYSLAFRLAYMPYPLVALVICGAAFAYLCRLRGRAVGRAASEVATVTTTVLVPLHLGLLLLAPQLQLLGEQWAPAVPVLRWLAVYGLVLGFVNACVVSLNAVARTRATLLVHLVHLVLLGAVVAVVAPRGIEAVAGGQLVVVVVVATFATWLVRRHVPGADWGRVRRGLRPAVVGGAAMAVVVLGGQVLLPAARVAVGGLVLLGLAGLTAYVVPVLALGRHRFGAATRLLEATS